MFYFFKAPLFIQRLYPNYLWSIHDEPKTIYLTFDDGPTPEITEWTLDVLAKYQAKATFFCLGKNVQKHRSVFKKIISEGHRIGNHTYSHLNGWMTHSKKYIHDVDIANKLLHEMMGNKAAVQLFRPPYGKIRHKQAVALRKKGYRIVMYDVISGDFDQNLSPHKALDKVLKHTKSGSIVVFHDSMKSKKTLQFILPKALKYWKQKGYKFKVID